MMVGTRKTPVRSRTLSLGNSPDPEIIEESELDEINTIDNISVSFLLNYSVLDSNMLRKTPQRLPYLYLTLSIYVHHLQPLLPHYSSLLIRDQQHPLLSWTLAVSLIFDTSAANGYILRILNVLI